MKKLCLAVLLIALAAEFAACDGNNEVSITTEPPIVNETTVNGNENDNDNDIVPAITQITIGATPRPHMEILEYIRPYLLEDGIELNLIEFTDFVVINPAVADGTLDANYFQHTPFLDASPLADELFMLGLVHIEPMGMYSLTIDDISQLPNGGTVAIPNDATNGGRALLLMQSHGILSLDPAAGIRATPFDIIDNPLNLVIEELDAAILPRILGDPNIDAAIINTNHVLAGTDLNPMRDSLIIETPDSPYGNGLAIRREDADNPVFHVIMEHLQSERVREFIYRQYEGAVVPVF